MQGLQEKKSKKLCSTLRSAVFEVLLAFVAWCSCGKLLLLLCPEVATLLWLFIVGAPCPAVDRVHLEDVLLLELLRVPGLDLRGRLLHFPLPLELCGRLLEAPDDLVLVGGHLGRL